MKSPIIRLFFISASLAAYALPGSFRPGSGGDDRLRFLVSNDSMGPGPVDEWDDLRTFGIGLSTGLYGPLAVAADCASLTWRSDSAASASRIDSLRIILAARLLDCTVRGMRFVASGSLGTNLLGDFGGIVIVLQEGFHGTFGIPRPVPTSYDACTPAALAGSLAAEGGLASGWLRPALFAAAEGGLPGSWRLQAGGRADLGGPGSGAALFALYRHELASGLSPTLDAVSRPATGAVVGLELEASYLTAAVEVNLSEGISSGAIGFRIGQGGFAEGLVGIPIALEIDNDFVRCATEYRALFPLFGPSVRVCAGAAFGWWSLPAPSGLGLRSSEYSAGIEGRVMLPLGRLEGELALALEPVVTVITVHPLDLERSQVQDHCLVVGIRFDPAVRLGLVQPLARGRIRKTGLGAVFAIEPLAWTPLQFTSWLAVSSRIFALRIFAFGEVR